MSSLLAIVWVGCVVYALLALLRPLWPFRTRWQVLLAGIPSLVVAMLILAAFSPPSEREAVTVSDPPSADQEVQRSQSLLVQAEPMPTGDPTNFDGARLTHHHDALDRRVTYREPKTVRLKRQSVADDIWSLSTDDTDIICFEDGNNAVFFTQDGSIMAANGKAGQFIDFERGDGIVDSDGDLIRIRQPDRGQHHKLISEIIRIGLELCGKKTMSETAAAVETASEETTQARSPHADLSKAAFLDAAFAIKGAEHCRFRLDPVAVVDYLETSGVGIERYEAEMDTYLALVTTMMGDQPDSDFCPELVWQRYGPPGLGFVSR